ncbi:GAF domain-containing protein [Sphingomonas sp. CFBP 13714]|uniref:GAF domain-containing protein n=1 Tax=Sphingomonas sp. CFBP 13714 TaxID=2775308 RepID=UPI00177BA84E|nr:GAF domain-containing protein [Sphingomonas sp. CFBP 13714]MBD8702084.1 GAF domain-containing protein [Sphingomonas sp. CFBP 13714]
MVDNEVSRASETRKYATGDENLQSVFDSVTQLCSNLFQAEISLLSFIEDDIQIVKGAAGLAATTISRTDSFCSHTILSSEVMVVLDAAKDVRFRGNRYVTAAPFIRFYAGAPLKTALGFNIGALCIADPRPRSDFSATDRSQLGQMASLISSRMDDLIVGHCDLVAPRHSVDLEGMISSYGKRPVSAAIQNISIRGAMINVAGALIPRGEEVVLSIGTVAIVATAMWTRNGMIGLSFDRPINDEDLASVHNSVRKAPATLPSMRGSSQIVSEQ